MRETARADPTNFTADYRERPATREVGLPSLMQERMAPAQQISYRMRQKDVGRSSRFLYTRYTRHDNCRIRSDFGGTLVNSQKSQVQMDGSQNSNSVETTRFALEALRLVIITLMEVAASVLVRVRSTHTKLRLTSDIWVLARAADSIGRRLPGLRSKPEMNSKLSRAYAEFLRDLILLPDPDQQFAKLTHAAYPDLRANAVRIAQSLNVLADEPSVQCLDEVTRLLATLHGSTETGSHVSGFSGQLVGKEDPNTLQSTHLVADTVAVLDLPEPLPAIPERPGRAVGLVEDDGSEPSAESFDLAKLLHDAVFGIELCAAEICATIIAHHPDAPWGLRLDMAKQVRDEGRHFELLTDRMEEVGARAGDYPISFDVWDKFLLGSTLAERIVIEQRLGEGIGLDGGLHIYRWANKNGDTKTAFLFDYINADEITHVGNGNRWLAELIGHDQAALADLDAGVRQLLASHHRPVVHAIPINATDRALAGFGPEEILDLQRQWVREYRNR